MAISALRSPTGLLIVGAVLAGGLCAAVSISSPAPAAAPPAIPDAGPVETASVFKPYGWRVPGMISGVGAASLGPLDTTA